MPDLIWPYHFERAPAEAPCISVITLLIIFALNWWRLSSLECKSPGIQASKPQGFVATKQSCIRLKSHTGAYWALNPIKNFRRFIFTLGMLHCVEPWLLNAQWNMLQFRQGFHSGRRGCYELKSDPTTQKMRKSCWAAGKKVDLLLSAQWIFSWIFVSRRKTCRVKIVTRKNDILCKIIKNCSSKVINY